MKSYEAIKQELSTRRSNIKGFNKAFYKTFSHDMDIIREAVKENENTSVTDMWRSSETHKTWFYKHNSAAYCEMLQICE